MSTEEKYNFHRLTSAFFFIGTRKRENEGKRKMLYRNFYAKTLCREMGRQGLGKVAAFEIQTSKRGGRRDIEFVILFRKRRKWREDPADRNSTNSRTRYACISMVNIVHGRLSCSYTFNMVAGLLPNGRDYENDDENEILGSMPGNRTRIMYLLSKERQSVEKKVLPLAISSTCWYVDEWQFIVDVLIRHIFIVIRYFPI